MSCLAIPFVATAQDQSAAAAKDVIQARKLLMNAIMDHMDAIKAMISPGPLDLRRGADHADNISVMLTAFPHLFPPSSNQWKEDVDLDPVTDTFASPDLWTDFADFYRRAIAAANTASELRRSNNHDDFKRLYRALGIACDTCHALYLKE